MLCAVAAATRAQLGHSGLEGKIMAWKNGPVALYHGTDDLSASLIQPPSPPLKHSVNLSKCNPLTDFGQGFYTTTNLLQARNWANNRYRRTLATSRRANRAVVLRFDVDRDLLAALNTLCFVTEGTSRDYWDFITHCRNAVGKHLFQRTKDYDVVFGPVSLWPQTLVIKDCDQISFHTTPALKTLPTPTLYQQGTPLF
jgi:hypothetical protein